METPLNFLTTETVNDKTKQIDRCSTKEILKIINSEDKLVPEAVDKELPNIAEAVDKIVPRLKAGGRLFYIGAGTSGRIGVLDASECPPTFGTDPEMIQGIIAGGDVAIRSAVEGAEDSEEGGRLAVHNEKIGSKDAIVGITASGRTPYVLAAIREAHAMGALTVGLSNNKGSELGKVCDIEICPVVGPEVITGSTRMKAGTSAKLVLNMITTTSMIKLGKVYGNLMVDVQANNKKLCERTVRIVRLVTSVSDEEAREALQKASLRPKVAIVMILGNMDCKSAERILSENDGFISRALETAGKSKIS